MHGLHHYRARYYDAAAGVFLSRDPIGVWGDPMGLGNPYAYVGNNPVNTIDPTGQFGLSDITNFLADVGRTVGNIIEGAVNLVYDAVSSTVDYVTHRTRSFVSEILPGITSDMFAILGRAGPALDEYLGRTPRLASQLPSDYFGEAADVLGDLNWKQGFEAVGEFFIEVGSTLGDWAGATGFFIKKEALEAKEIYWDRCMANITMVEKVPIQLVQFSNTMLVASLALATGVSVVAAGAAATGAMWLGTAAGCMNIAIHDPDHSWVWE